MKVLAYLFCLSILCLSALVPTGASIGKAPRAVTADRPYVYNLMVNGRAICTAFGVQGPRLERYALSAGHCVARGTSIGSKASLKDSLTGREYPVVLRAFSLNWPKEDYSIWHYSDWGNYPHGGITATKVVPVLGDEVWTIGGPLGMTPMLSGGVYAGMSGCATPGDEACELADMHSITAVATYGSSGSPVMDAQGRVWGILVGGHPRLPGMSQIVLLPEPQ